MIRKSIATPIEDTIRSFYEKDTAMKSIKKEVEEKKETIKNYFIDNSIEEMSVDGIKCTVSSSERSTFNTDRCLAVLSNMLINEEIDKNKYDSIVKMQPYIDEDALEKAIYNNEFDPAKLSDCIESKTIYTLRVSKKKGK